MQAEDLYKKILGIEWAHLLFVPQLKSDKFVDKIIPSTRQKSRA